jgi:hypothetical protein
MFYCEAEEMAQEFGLDLMSTDIYKKMQKIGSFDIHTWSWLSTPINVTSKKHAFFGNRNKTESHVEVVSGLLRLPYIGWRAIIKVPRNTSISE